MQQKGSMCIIEWAGVLHLRSVPTAVSVAIGLLATSSLVGALCVL
jgi:hypothetical protein